MYISLCFRVRIDTCTALCTLINLESENFTCSFAMRVFENRKCKKTRRRDVSANAQ